MKIFMIGGTGLLGSEAAKELIARGHEVSSLALPPLPAGAMLPPEMKLEFGNYLEMSDEELKGHLTGCEGFVFAAGVDERVEGPAPIYDLYKKYNIDPVKRLLALCRDCGVQHVAICGSYFSYAAKKWPEKELTKWHPYIRSRIDQEEAAMAFAKDMDVAVLELPYIFGTQPGRKPVWVFLVENVMSMKAATLYPKGGSTMVTVHQVAEAIAGAIERNRGGNCYPIGYYNLTWVELLKIVHKYLGVPDKKIVTIPNWMYAIGGKKIMKEQQEKGIQGGLHMVKFTDIMCSNLFIDKSEGCDFLGVTDDDIDAAIGDSILLCKDIIEKKTQVLGMKGE
ncbi:MAG: NAD-dependent epimerase/dehydratase family protein [Clostridia bacterium]|nr:NAD-dependent epimerase/dehydratase family protein [Clostridia bacterium]